MIHITVSLGSKANQSAAAHQAWIAYVNRHIDGIVGFEVGVYPGDERGDAIRGVDRERCAAVASAVKVLRARFNPVN